MVVVLAPYPLRVISDVRVVMATLGCAVMNAHAMQVIWHTLQICILVLKQTLLSGNLFLQAFNLNLDFVAISVEHLLHQVRLYGILAKGQVRLDVSHICTFERCLRNLLVALSLEEMEHFRQST